VTEITTLDFSDFPTECQPVLMAAAETLREADNTVGQIVWQTGQKLSFAREACPPGRWLEFLARCGVPERRAQQYLAVYGRFERAELPNVGRQLLIELAAPSTPETVIDAVVERVESGAPAPSVRELKDEIKEAQAPAPINHDIDRTRQEPNVATTEGREAVERLIAQIRKQVAKGVAICSQLKDESVWLLLQQSLENMASEVEHA
jgi:hypothetical protein